MLQHDNYLDNESLIELELEIDNILILFKKKKTDLATRELARITHTNNFFLRKETGRLLFESQELKILDPILKVFLTNKAYGIRAVAFVYFSLKLQNSPESLLAFVGKYHKNIRWESEDIMNSLWEEYREDIKPQIKKFAKSKTIHLQELSFIGLEKIIDEDIDFVLEMVEIGLNNKAEEIQESVKKILDIIIKKKPIETYPYLREWLVICEKPAQQMILYFLKKIAKLISQSERKELSIEFMILAQQLIDDWKNDRNQEIKTIGNELSRMTHY